MRTLIPYLVVRRYGATAMKAHQTSRELSHISIFEETDIEFLSQNGARQR
jgi:hypothetical protein